VGRNQAEVRALARDSLVTTIIKRGVIVPVARLTLLKAPCYGGARAEVAQLAEHSPEKAGVDSSILSLGTIPR
jgi:hypothetical protein